MMAKCGDASGSFGSATASSTWGVFGLKGGYKVTDIPPGFVDPLADTTDQKTGNPDANEDGGGD